jgi:hypothetical protein
MWEETQVDDAADVLKYLEDNRDTAEEAVAKARTKLTVAQLVLADAEERVLKQKHLVERMGQVTPAPRPTPVAAGTPEEPEEVVTVDATTGEVVDEKAPSEGVVLVVYPGDGDDDPEHKTEVGAHTQYAELVADYLSAAGIDEPVEGYCVYGQDLEDEDKDTERGLREVIAPADYGRTLFVEKREEGEAAPQELTPGKRSIVECGECSGTGFVDDEEGESFGCSICGGRGIIAATLDGETGEVTYSQATDAEHLAWLNAAEAPVDIPEEPGDAVTEPQPEDDDEEADPEPEADPDPDPVDPVDEDEEDDDD